MKVRLMVLVIFALFVMPLVFVQRVSAFAENPIPYWDDDSLDVATTWDSVDQTVTVESDSMLNESQFWEPFTPVYTWVEHSFEGDDWSETPAGILGIHSKSDGANDLDRYYTNNPSLPSAPYDMSVKWKINQTVDVNYIYLIAYTLDTMAGDSQIGYIASGFDTNWHITTKTFTQAVESVEIRISSDNAAQTLLEVDWVRITDGTGDLDIGVPLIQQPIQSVEFMGNFSALDSTVRFQMYDTDTGLGLWCDVNSTQVTFPDAAYAEFTNIARINFSLNEEIRIFTIYVSRQNTTLINYYSEYAGLANKDYLRMTDSAFNGSYQLWYFLEEVTDITDNIFYQLFLSLEMWGYLGPIALVVLGYVLAKKDRGLGLIAFIVQCLFVATYFTLIEATPAYWWHVIIILVGGILTCVVPLMDKR